MKANYVLNDYFEWLYFMVVDTSRQLRYRKLFALLHDMEFEYHVDYDENRASDGMNLRWYYVDDGGDDEILRWKAPATVLEVIISIAMHMDNISGEYGVQHWFWMMIKNLDLDWMVDEEFNKAMVYGKVSIFMDRAYEPDGNGNIIYIPDCPEDLRKIEIWNQMCWYLDSIL